MYTVDNPGGKDAQMRGLREYTQLKVDANDGTVLFRLARHELTLYSPTYHALVILETKPPSDGNWDGHKSNLQIIAEDIGIEGYEEYSQSAASRLKQQMQTRMGFTLHPKCKEQDGNSGFGRTRTKKKILMKEKTENSTIKCKFFS